MTCRELIDFIREYLDGELPVSQRELFEAHLNLCPPCVDYLKSYQQTIDLCRAACQPVADPPVPPPAKLVEAILAACRDGAPAPSDADVG